MALLPTRTPWPPASRERPARIQLGRLPWRYDEQETCLLLQGRVTVPRDVHVPVRNHYRFGTALSEEWSGCRCRGIMFPGIMEIVAPGRCGVAVLIGTGELAAQRLARP